MNPTLSAIFAGSLIKRRGGRTTLLRAGLVASSHLTSMLFGPKPREWWALCPLFSGTRKPPLKAVTDFGVIPIQAKIGVYQ